MVKVTAETGEGAAVCCGDCARFRQCRLEEGAVAQNEACWDFMPVNFYLCGSETIRENDSAG